MGMMRGADELGNFYAHFWKKSLSSRICFQWRISEPLGLDFATSNWLVLLFFIGPQKKEPSPLLVYSRNNHWYIWRLGATSSETNGAWVTSDSLKTDLCWSQRGRVRAGVDDRNYTSIALVIEDSRSFHLYNDLQQQMTRSTADLTRKLCWLIDGYA
jgi:hypothetical protein